MEQRSEANPPNDTWSKDDSLSRGNMKRGFLLFVGGVGIAALNQYLGRQRWELPSLVLTLVAWISVF